MADTYRTYGTLQLPGEEGKTLRSGTKVSPSDVGSQEAFDKLVEGGSVVKSEDNSDEEDNREPTGGTAPAPTASPQNVTPQTSGERAQLTGTNKPVSTSTASKTTSTK